MKTEQRTECGMPNSECGIQALEAKPQTASSITHHASRITHHASRFSRAFTLIELLIVISVIALLAGLTFPAVRAAKLSVTRARVRSEMIQIETAIERYKDKLGYYPPDNPNNWARNQLYYELLGTTNVGTVAAPIYVTLDGSAKIAGSDLNAAFKLGVTGFMNCARPGRGDDAPSAMPFLSNIKPGQIMMLTNLTHPQLCTILVCALEGPSDPSNPGLTGVTAWRYNSSSPRFNPKSFDLWIDIMAGGKTNRISNWSDKPIIVNDRNPY
jgi:prepilin-type N-terminal cleavage/methylation domain-containing protein